MLILGKSGHAEEVRDIAEAAVPGWRVHLVGPGEDEQWLAQPGLILAALGTGTPEVRRRLFERYSPRVEWKTLVHPRAWVSPRAHVEPGAVIAPGAIVGAGAFVGTCALVNYNVTLGHGCRIECLAVVLPGANLACDSVVGEGALVGAGAQLLPKVKVGRNAVVAASSMVNRDVPDGHHAVGVPARIMKLEAESAR